MNFKTYEVQTDDEIRACTDCINEAFAIVASRHKLTKENAPNNGAFLDFGKLKSEIGKGLKLFMCVDADSGYVVGTVGIKLIGDQRWELSRLSVHPSLQGRGIGAGLLGYIEKHINDRSFDKEVTIALGCIAEDEALISFYENNGFETSSIKAFKKLPHKVCFMKKKVKK